MAGAFKVSDLKGLLKGSGVAGDMATAVWFCTSRLARQKKNKKNIKQPERKHDQKHEEAASHIDWPYFVQCQEASTEFIAEALDGLVTSRKPRKKKVPLKATTHIFITNMKNCLPQVTWQPGD